jgi:predicted RNA-binding protein with PUA-like domain
MARYWLLKTEPQEYSFGDLAREGRGLWDGVRNPQAQAGLRAMAPGDRAAVYHTGRERAAVGLAEVAAPPRPDPAEPRYAAVELVPLGWLKRPVTLGELRAEAQFAGSPLLRQPRLSVVPLTEGQWKRLRALGGLPPPRSQPLPRQGEGGTAARCGSSGDEEVTAPPRGGREARNPARTAP